MFVRRKINRSGSISISVVDKSRGRYEVVRSFGAAKTAAEADLLENRAREFVREQTGEPETLFDKMDEAQLRDYAAHRPGWALAPNNYEGVRVDLDGDHGDGWFLLRMSLHEPLMPLNMESDSAGGVKAIARELVPFLQRFDKLDTAALAEFAR